MRTIVSKAEYAAAKGRGASAVSNWIASGRLTAAALVGSGTRAKVWVEQADRDLSRNLDEGQQEAQQAPILPYAASQPTREPDDLGRELREAKLRRMRYENERLAIDAEVRAGRLVAAADVGSAFHRAATMWIAQVDGWLPEVASKIVAQKPETQRDALHLMRNEFAALRKSVAVSYRSAAALLPEHASIAAPDLAASPPIDSDAADDEEVEQ